MSNYTGHDFAPYCMYTYNLIVFMILVEINMSKFINKYLKLMSLCAECMSSKFMSWCECMS